MPNSAPFADCLFPIRLFNLVVADISLRCFCTVGPSIIVFFVPCPIIFVDFKVADIFLSDPELELISSGPNLYDVMCKGVSKGNALIELADYLGIPADNTFAIGDSDNDLSMIRSAKYGIAVGNATDEIKKAASYISTNYDSLGFAKAVYEFVIPLVKDF